MTSQHSPPPFRARCADEGHVPALPLADGSVSIGLTSRSGVGGMHGAGLCLGPEQFAWAGPRPQALPVAAQRVLVRLCGYLGLAEQTTELQPKPRPTL